MEGWKAVYLGCENSHIDVIHLCRWVLGSCVNVNWRALFHKEAREHLSICSSSQASALQGGVGTSWIWLPTFSFITLQSWCSTVWGKQRAPPHETTLSKVRPLRDPPCQHDPQPFPTLLFCLSNHLHTCWELEEHAAADTDRQKPEHAKYTSKLANTQRHMWVNTRRQQWHQIRRARCISLWFYTMERTQRQQILNVKQTGKSK